MIINISNFNSVDEFKREFEGCMVEFFNNPYNRFNVEFVSEDDFDNISGIFEPNYGEWYTVIHM